MPVAAVSMWCEYLVRRQSTRRTQPHDASMIPFARRSAGHQICSHEVCSPSCTTRAAVAASPRRSAYECRRSDTFTRSRRSLPVRRARTHHSHTHNGATPPRRSRISTPCRHEALVPHRSTEPGRPRHRRRTQWLISTQVVYGYGSPFSSTKFGRAAANLMDGVMLRRLHQGLVPPSLRPEDHSPLEGYAKVSPST